MFLRTAALVMAYRKLKQLHALNEAYVRSTADLQIVRGWKESRNCDQRRTTSPVESHANPGSSFPQTDLRWGKHKIALVVRKHELLERNRAYCFRKAAKLISASRCYQCLQERCSEF